MKRLLIVSPHFPPGCAPDMQRVRMSLRTYFSEGWAATVLAVDERWQDGPRDPELAAALPPEARIIRVPALPPRWSRRFGIGNTGLRAWPFLLWKGGRLLRREKFDLVFFSTTQFAVFLLGPLWKTWFRVPYVLDFQDPWLTDAYERPGARPAPGGWKYRFARLQARLFEKWVVTRAAGLMSVSPAYLDDLESRYGAFGRKATAVLPFGASREDIEQARRLAPPAWWEGRDRTRRHLVYTGASGPIAPHVLSLLLAGLADYQREAPERAARLKLHFIGTSYGEGKGARPTILPLAGSFGVAGLVEEVPGRIAFLEALRLQADADGLLLLGGSDPAYLPSKAFVYYLTEKPILALIYSSTVLDQLLGELSCSYRVPIRPGDPPGGPAPQLAQFFDALVEGAAGRLMPARDPALFEGRYLAERLALRQCRLFEAALA